MKKRLVLLSLLLSTPSLAAEAVQRFAMVVGANHGGSERVVLRYAESDAEAFVGVMSDLGGLRPDNIVMLREPTRADFLRSLRELDRLVTQKSGDSRSEVILYYSGHSDELGLLMYGERVGYKELRDGLDAIDTDVRIAVIDSCSSGAMIRSKGGAVVPPFLVDEASGVSGHAYMTSSSADEAAQEADRLMGSYFTHYLVSGLRGAADATGDGRVTLSEAYHFAYNETLKQTENTRFGPQHAAHDIHLSGTGDLVLTDLSVVDAGLVFDPGLSGRLFVRDGNGRLVAELYKESGRSVELGLGSGRYKIRLQRDDATYEARVNVGRGQRARLDLSHFSMLERVATVARGDGAASPARNEVPAVLALAPFPGSPGSKSNTRLGLGLVGVQVGELHGAALSLAYSGTTADSGGVMFTTGVNVARSSFRGTQISVVGDWTQGDHTGSQLTTGVNVVAGRLLGLQFAVGANVAGRDVKGTQLSVGANVAAGTVQGGQLSVGANVAGGPLRGAQLSVGANIAPAASRGAQISSGVNIAGNGFSGLQLGLLNIGRDVHGAQIGLLNIAGHVRGSQIGLVNVSKSVEGGVPVGLINVVKEGQIHGEVWASDSYLAGGGVQFGSKVFFTTLQVGYSPDQRTLFAGAGLGVHVPAGPMWVEVDAIIGPAVDSIKGPASSHFMLRASTGVEVKPHFSPMVGVQLNVLATGRGDAPNLRGWMLPDGVPDESRAAVWPGVYAGVQF